MVAAQSPTVRRRELAARLRALRRDAGRSVDEVAQHLLCSPAKISRIETAQRSASPRDVRDLCDYYGVTDAHQRDQLMELAQLAKQRAWWQGFEEVNQTYQTLIGLEAEAVSVRAYESILVPGLLQTADYARAVIEAGQPDLSADSISRLVEVRQNRQAILTGNQPPSFWAILDEGVAHRLVGGSQVMAEQLRQLVRFSQLPHVTVQLVSFEAGAHAGMTTHFVVLEFAQREVEDVVYIEGLTGALYLDRDEELARHRRTFDYLRATAASPAASAARLRVLAEQYERDQPSGAMSG